MPTLKTVERKIAEVEGFRAVFMKDGRDVRDDLQNIPQYPYSDKAKGTFTVSEWIYKRFKATYPGFDVKVYCKDGTPAIGQKTLAVVRGEK